MGSLILPASGVVYADANIATYSVDRHPVYAPLCGPLWLAAQNGILTVVSSELTLMEMLIGPLRSGDSVLAAHRENLWNRPNTRLLPITIDILREAARLRALDPGIRTPDALHAATALLHSCVLFVTNDVGFRRVPGLPLILLDDVLAVREVGLNYTEGSDIDTVRIAVHDTVARFLWKKTNRRPFLRG